MLRRSFAVAMVGVALGCSESSPEGAQPDARCSPGAMELADGSCLAAGIPAAQCAAGFAPTDDAGCRPVLPEQPCEAGLLAVPGETSCRELVPCGQGPWGDIPVDGNTQYVDQSYGGGDSDGGASRPWTAIADAVQAALPGAIVAIAPGVYQEDLLLSGKAVRLWGRCPAMVEIAGTGASPAGVMATLTLYQAPGVELHDLAVTGPGVGIVAGNITSVLLDRVWVHDTGRHGIHVQHNGGPTDAHIVGSLVEQAHSAGLLVQSARVLVEGSVVRGTLVRESQGVRIGRGISVQDDSAGAGRAVVDVVGSLVAHNGLMSIFVGGSDLTIDGSVLGNIYDPLPADGDVGVMAIHGPTPGRRANVVIRGSVVASAFRAGIAAVGADVLVESTVVRDTAPRSSDQYFGRGLSVSNDAAVAEPSVVTLRQSVVERSYDAGVLLSGSTALIESTIIRDTAPSADSGRFGRGITVQVQPGSGATSFAEVRGCVVERSHEVGVVVLGSELALTDSAVIDTQPQQSDGLYGDSLSVASLFNDLDGTPLERLASAQLERSALIRGARAGIANFGASARIADVAIECNAIDLDGEVSEGVPFTFDDAGNNRCGCAGTAVACRVLSTGLEPPVPSH